MFLENSHNKKLLNILILKHLLVITCLLFMSSPLIAQKTGVFYLKKVNGKYGWFKSGDEKKHWKYEGEIKKGRPNGIGVLSRRSVKYSGEVKNGIAHGIGTYTFKSGKKRVGEFRRGKPWNAKFYDRNGKIEAEYVNGKKLKTKATAAKKGKERKEKKSYQKLSPPLEIGIRVLLGNSSGDSTTSNSSLTFLLENFGLGINQMTFKRTSKKNNVYDMTNSSVDLSYTLDLSYIFDWSATAGFGYIYDGKGSIASGSTAITYESESVSGYGLFGLFGIEWEGLGGLIGLRYYSVEYADFKSTTTSDKLGIAYSIGSADLILGIEYSF